MQDVPYMLPPCSLPNRCAPTCACRQYGASGEEQRLSLGKKVFGGISLGLIALLFAGAFTADAHHERRLRERERRYLR
jgi:hypothetical protein